jgi:hypothetical protein
MVWAKARSNNGIKLNSEERSRLRFVQYNGRHNTFAVTLAAIDKNKNDAKMHMKSIIPLSAITLLAALTLVGCNQSSPSNSTETPSPSSSMNHSNGMMGMMGGTTNMPTTNTMPHLNMPARTNTTGSANDATR